MSLKKEMGEEQYALFFGVLRSVRYHDRRQSFFELLHRMSSGLTVLLAGSVLFELARPGQTALWMIVLAVPAAFLSAWDVVVGYANHAKLHNELKRRFITLQIAIVSEDNGIETWTKHEMERLMIERDEPPIYHALNMLCHNEMVRAEGADGAQVPVGVWQRLTSHIFHWSDSY